MRILKKLIQLPWMACYLAWGLGTEYIENHKLPFAVFGTAFGVLFGVAAYAYFAGPTGFWQHVLDRNIQMHLCAGVALYLLFSRLLIVVEHLRGHRRFHWFVWFFAPVAAVMAISICQEYVFSILGGPETRWQWGGDYRANGRAGDYVAQFKSFADNATWFAGSMAAAWYCYYCPERNLSARHEYLTIHT